MMYISHRMPGKKTMSSALSGRPTQRSRRPLALIALMAGLSCLVMTASASQPIRNVVLVHGAFADGSSWSDVIGPCLADARAAQDG
jgi:hypothetical protein